MGDYFRGYQRTYSVCTSKSIIISFQQAVSSAIAGHGKCTLVYVLRVLHDMQVGKFDKALFLVMYIL